MTTIETVEQLAEHLGAAPTEASIQKRIFQSTSCGCSSRLEMATRTTLDNYTEIEEVAFHVAGYCEGCDWELPNYTLHFPFSTDDLNKTIHQADQDGIEAWTRTHGCEHCQTADCTVDFVPNEGWRISWDGGDTWWQGATPRKKQAGIATFHSRERRPAPSRHELDEDPIEYRADEWEIRVDFSCDMDEFGVIAINPDCAHCGGHGQVI